MSTSASRRVPRAPIMGSSTSGNQQYARYAAGASLWLNQQRPTTLALLFFVVILPMAVAKLKYMSKELVICSVLLHVFVILATGLYLMRDLHVRHENSQVGTISELCRKTNTYNHKMLMYLCVSVAYFSAGIYFCLCVLTADYDKYGSNVLCSLALSLTGIFPTSNYPLDDLEREANPGAGLDKNVTIYNYDGESVSSFSGSMSRLFHNSGILIYITVSLFNDLVENQILPWQASLILLCLFFFALRIKNNFSIYLEAALVFLVFVVHLRYCYSYMHEMSNIIVPAIQRLAEDRARVNGS